jgi:hypothetical protein
MTKMPSITLKPSLWATLSFGVYSLLKNVPSKGSSHSEQYYLHALILLYAVYRKVYKRLSLFKLGFT